MLFPTLFQTCPDVQELLRDRLHALEEPKHAEGLYPQGASMVKWKKQPKPGINN